MEEAIFYGILEVVERDSFLMTWYAQMALPRLDPIPLNDQELQLMIERCERLRDMIYIYITRQWSTGFQVYWR